MESMKTITFIRHGKPVIWKQYSPFSLVRGGKIADILDTYDHCDIDNKIKNFNQIQKLIKNGDLFLSSNLKRAKDSFQLLGITDFQENDLLNEPRLPANLFAKDFRLPIFIWAILLRIVWLSGYDRNCESMKVFKKRMDRAIDFLETKLVAYDHIIIMGHGFVNFFMIRRLLKKGWRKRASTTLKKFWSYTQIVEDDVI
jgi:broad specificity phosphatase PhoE